MDELLDCVGVVVVEFRVVYTSVACEYRSNRECDADVDDPAGVPQAEQRDRTSHRLGAEERRGGSEEGQLEHVKRTR